MRLFVVAAALALAATACSLRPRYNDVMTADLKPPTARFVVVNPTAGDAPVAGAKVQWGEARTRFSTVSDAAGIVELPVDPAKFSKDNPVVEVIVPKGVKGYRLVPVPAAGLDASSADVVPGSP